MVSDNAKWMEGKVFALLSKPFPPPSYVWLSGVRNGTGFERKARTADAIGVSCWPSRGLYLVDVEIKVSRSDWRSELSNPAKASEWEKYCRCWYVAAPEGIVPLAEVPETWGLIECKGKDASVVKAAPRRETIEPDMLLLASIMRSVAKCTVPATVVEQQIDDAKREYREYIEKTYVPSCEVERLRELQVAVETFEKEAGVKLGGGWSRRYGACELGRQVAFLEKTNLLGLSRIAEDLQKRFGALSSGIADALAMIKTATEQKG